MLKRRDFLKVAGGTALTLPWLSVYGDSPKKILYFDLATKFDHQPTVVQKDGLSLGGKFISQFGKELDYEVECTKDGSVFERDLSSYAAFVFYTCDDLTEVKPNQIPLTPRGEKNLLAAIRNGAGFLGLHSTVWTWGKAGPDSKIGSEFNTMLGAGVRTHGEQQEATVRFTDPVQLPSLIQFKASSCRHFEEWYPLTDFNKDIHVIAIQDTQGMKNTGPNACYNRPPYPCTWIRKEGNGRVAYTSLGHDNKKISTPFASGLIKDLLSFIVGKLELDMTPNL